MNEKKMKMKININKDKKKYDDNNTNIYNTTLLVCDSIMFMLGYNENSLLLLESFFFIISFGMANSTFSFLSCCPFGSPTSTPIHSTDASTGRETETTHRQQTTQLHEMTKNSIQGFVRSHCRQEWRLFYLLNSCSVGKGRMR